MFEYMVQFKTKKFVIQIANKDTLFETISKKVDENFITIEVYHEKFEEYYEIATSDEAPDFGRLRITSWNNSTIENSTDNAIAITESIETIENITENDTINESISTKEIVINEIGVSTKNKTSHHSRFTLNVDLFPAVLKQTLRNKEKWCTSYERSLNACLYEQITTFEFYPTTAQYGQIIEELLSKFPHLSQGLAYTDAVSYWRMSITNKMRNMRRKRDNSHPEAQEKRKKLEIMKLGAENKHPPQMLQKKNSLAYGMPNYLADRPSTEDDESIAAHKMQMKKQAKRNERDVRTVDKLMDLTFADRRQMIVRHNASTADIKQEYPCLFDTYQILYECKRLSEVDVAERMSESLNKYSAAIFALCGIDGGDVEPARRRQLALLQIPQLMNEVVTFKTPVDDEAGTQTSSPMIHFDGEPMDIDASCRIESEGTTLCHAEGLEAAVTAWIASYY